MSKFSLRVEFDVSEVEKGGDSVRVVAQSLDTNGVVEKETIMILPARWAEIGGRKLYEGVDFLEQCATQTHRTRGSQCRPAALESPNSSPSLSPR